MRTVRVVVRGRVQGVGFRWFVREAARRAELAGWVRNLEDGSVALEASGTPEGIAFLLDALRRGPPRSRVDDVIVSDGVAAEALTRPFSVMR